VKASVPVFALVFIALCLLNSAMPFFPAAMPLYSAVKAPLSDAATWGLLIAIAALGLGTSFSAMGALGWRHIATMIGTTGVILAIVTMGLLLMR